MIHLAALRPSELLALPERIHDEKFQKEFLQAIVEFLTAIADDVGADRDTLITTGLKLSQVKIWDHIPLSDLAETLIKTPKRSRKLFMRGMPGLYRAKIAEILDDMEFTYTETPLDEAKRYERLIKVHRSEIERLTNAAQGLLPRESDTSKTPVLKAKRSVG